MTTPSIVWLPRADEHDLARSLGLVGLSADALRDVVAKLTDTTRVGRWHVHRVVRVMARHGMTNTPADRARAFALLAKLITLTRADT